MFTIPINIEQPIKLNINNVDIAGIYNDDFVITETLENMYFALSNMTDFACTYIKAIEDPGSVIVVSDEYKTRIIKIHNKDEELFSIEIGLQDLAKELIADIEPLLNDGIYGYDMGSIKMKLQALKAVYEDIKRMPELGNLLFGNSRGEYRLERERNQDVFNNFLYDNGFDGYGHYQDEVEANERGGYTNETFEINPYYWGENEDEANKPNFIFKPTGLQISWYKYPLRDSYSSEPLTTEQLRKILADCAKSLHD